jgi:hypothetical protein
MTGFRDSTDPHQLNDRNYNDITERRRFLYRTVRLGITGINWAPFSNRTEMAEFRDPLNRSWKLLGIVRFFNDLTRFVHQSLLR